MKIHFCRSKGPAAWLIRVGTMSNWNHVAIEISGVVFHAEALAGVNAASPDALTRKYDEVETASIEGMDEGAALAFLKAQLGKKYDWGAVLGMPFRADWHDPKKWFCSELAAAALEKAGRGLRIDGHRITPRDLWVAI